MEQLLQLERLKKTDLSAVQILAVSPDMPEKTRALIAKLETSRGVHLTHRFLSDPEMTSAGVYQVRNRSSAKPLPHPTIVLIDLEGEEVWRFTETDYKVRPTDDDLRKALSLFNAQKR